MKNLLIYIKKKDIKDSRNDIGPLSIQCMLSTRVTRTASRACTNAGLYCRCNTFLPLSLLLCAKANYPNRIDQLEKIDKKGKINIR